MNALVASVIRTYTPIIAGQLGAWLIMIHMPVNPNLAVLLTALVGGGLSLAYYTLVRVLEQQWPMLGLLLGVPQSPDTYSKGDPASAPAAQSVVADKIVDNSDFMNAVRNLPAPASTTFPSAALVPAEPAPIAVKVELPEPTPAVLPEAPAPTA